MIVARIEEARKSQSGKTLGIKLNGRWYQTKHWELEQMVGEVITVTDHDSSPWQGKTIHWLNEYTVGGDEVVPGVTSASAARETNKGRPDAADNYTKNVLLLRFIGQCFAGYPFQTTDAASIRYRAKMLYELGQDILSGKITEVETGPRRQFIGSGRIEGVHNVPLTTEWSSEYRSTMPPEQEDQQEFEDDIPF